MGSGVVLWFAAVGARLEIFGVPQRWRASRDCSRSSRRAWRRAEAVLRLRSFVLATLANAARFFWTRARRHSTHGIRLPAKNQEGGGIHVQAFAISCTGQLGSAQPQRNHGSH